jgi:hypothetical protein
MPISLCLEVCHGRPKKHIVDEAKSVCEWVSDLVEDRHFVSVVLINMTHIMVDGDWSHGAIWYDEDSRDPEVIVIQVCCDLGSLSKQDQTRTFLSTFFHEFIHYEQIRDKRKVTERNVDKKAEKLLELYLEERDS